MIAMNNPSIVQARDINNIVLSMVIFFACNAFWQYYCARILFTLIERYEHERQQRRYSYFNGAESEEEESESEDFSVLLNRAPDYLRNTAISFARLYNLSEPVSELYVTKDQLPKREQKQKRKRRVGALGTRKKMLPFTDADFSRWDTTKKIEPIFDLPIDRGSFWLSSPFGPRREPGGRRGFHFGVDMAAVRGTLVKSAGNGMVIFAGNMPGYGNVVVIKHDGKFKTRYAHLSKILTNYGTQVTAGNIIGKVGSTGNSRASGKMRDASHLHFEVEMYGKRVNPFYFFK